MKKKQYNQLTQDTGRLAKGFILVMSLRPKLKHEFYRKASLIHKFMNQCKAIFASPNICDSWIFLSLHETSRFPSNLVHKKRHLKFSLLYTCMWHVNFSNICAWNRIRTPPFARSWKRKLSALQTSQLPCYVSHLPGLKNSKVI